jgi:hypothetical protein
LRGWRREGFGCWTFDCSEEANEWEDRADLKVFWFIVLRDYYLKKWELEEDRCLGLHPQASGIILSSRPFGRVVADIEYFSVKCGTCFKGLNPLLGGVPKGRGGLAGGEVIHKPTPTPPRRGFKSWRRVLVTKYAP